MIPNTFHNDPSDARPDTIPRCSPVFLVFFCLFGVWITILGLNLYDVNMGFCKYGDVIDLDRDPDLEVYLREYGSIGLSTSK